MHTVNKVATIIIIFIVGVCTGILFSYDIGSSSQAILFSTNDVSSASNANESNEHNIRVCFTPPSGCAALIARELDKATTSIHMHAYGLTHKGIATALINAQKRGVKVSILLDRSNETQKYSKMSALEAVGIDIAIDRVSGIAHNKVIIIDNTEVITGSFNFTTSADTRNTENVVLIEDPNIARSYLENWMSRYEVSTRLR